MKKNDALVRFFVWLATLLRRPVGEVMAYALGLALEEKEQPPAVFLSCPHHGRRALTALLARMLREQGCVAVVYVDGYHGPIHP